MELMAYLKGAAAVGFVLGFAPLFAGLINKQKALMTGRIGAPVLQPYYELIRLFRKETVSASGSSFVSLVSPLVSAAAVALAAAIVPVGFAHPLVSFEGDIILFAYLLGLARFF